MKIQVTLEDIQKGKRFNPNYCPIALAASRACGKMVCVGHTCMQVLGEFGYRDLPDVARNFTYLFDNNESVQPFEFEINL